MIPKRFKYSQNSLQILDQRFIPFKIKYFEAKTVEDCAKAIREMMVRGAPLIGDVAALGYLLGIDNILKMKLKKTQKILSILQRNADILKESRPTAVSLFKAIDRIHSKAEKLIEKGYKIGDLREEVQKEAFKIIEEDINSTLAISMNGIKLLKNNSVVITYCNTGSLATAGIGTALGIITQGYKYKKISHVYACETRPYLQGSRLTSWELMKNNIPYTLICDNMAGWIMKIKKIDAIIIGADRIASNGDTANKIGSYSLSVLAKKHNIPFYVAAPTDTFDTTLKNGSQIKIEERSIDEIIKIKNVYIAHPKTKAFHPAFDVVPNNLITAIITEKGIIKKPNTEKIKHHLSNT